jgi:hypothetical protein
LLDIVNSPEFVQAGGWFQPIPAVPTTFGLLMQRISTLGAMWLSSVTVVETLWNPKAQQGGSPTAWIQPSDWMTFAVFCSLRLLMGCVLDFVSAYNVASTSVNNDLILITLRDCYFVGLFTFTLRYLYRQYFP